MWRTPIHVFSVLIISRNNCKILVKLFMCRYTKVAPSYLQYKALLKTLKVVIKLLRTIYTGLSCWLHQEET